MLAPLIMTLPVMAQDQFSQLTGLTQGVVRGMVERGQLPSVKIGRYRLINVVALVEQCSDSNNNNSHGAAVGSTHFNSGRASHIGSSL
ncbi:hypothetical protein [Thalassolituus oleivorans]|uniref:hypothetical protein n=1 Tax=Thalassolituus oleivorans TaxID=187493 RepID=UPI0023F4FA64|nr:hypothetical protein [Thalassolituus oleivorans]